MAKWRHVRHVFSIPAILTNHCLSSDDPSKAQVLQVRLFSSRSPNVPEYSLMVSQLWRHASFPSSPARKLPPPSPPHQGNPPQAHQAKTTSYCTVVKWTFAAHSDRLYHLDVFLRVGPRTPKWKLSLVDSHQPFSTYHSSHNRGNSSSGKVGNINIDPWFTSL